MQAVICGMQVRETGCMVIIGDDPIRFDLGSGFIVNIRFLNDTTQKGQNRRICIENNELCLTFVNYVGKLAFSNSSPLQLGEIDHKKICFNYAILYIGDENLHSRIFHYTFLESSAADKGGLV